MRFFLRFFACLSLTFTSLVVNTFLPVSAKSSNLGPAPVASNTEKKGSANKNSGAVSKSVGQNAKNNTGVDVSSKVKVEQSKGASVGTTSMGQESKSENTKNSGNADQNSKNKKVDSRDLSVKNSAPESKSVAKKAAPKNGSKVRSNSSNKGSLNTGAKTGEAKLEDENTAPESWSVENKAEEEPVSSEGNFSAIQNSSTEDKSSNKAKWLFYSGVGLILFSLIGLAFFALLLVRNNRRLHGSEGSDPDEDVSY